MSIPTTTRQYSFPQRGSYHDLELQVVSLPAPKSNEVRVKTHAVSLQFRDLKISQNAFPGFIPPNLVPCSDMAGEVIAVGADVTQWKIGDRVSCYIMLDETGELPTADLGGTVHAFPANSLVSIPAHLSYEEAATLPCAAVTTYHALTGGFAPVKAGDIILILGTGGVSTWKFTELGAKHVINYKTTPQWDEKVLKLTNGFGVDRVIEVVGNSTLQRSIASAKANGNIELIGFLGGLSDVPPPDIIMSTIQKGITIGGVYIGSLQQFKDMNKLITANIHATRPVIDKIFAFEDVKAAYAHLESVLGVGKVVIRF
ncbi:chaperonin 10-like protein [Mycena epipterygia]|nr:chaperonin 10-like protein [Mycena epipterygia]